MPEVKLYTPSVTSQVSHKMDHIASVRQGVCAQDGLTLIIPVYNRQAELDRALDSVTQQDLDLKVIVVDDASSRPIEIRQYFASRLQIDLIRCDQNGGAATARNFGLAGATTEWATFLDSDDSLCSQTLEQRWLWVKKDQADAPNPRVIYGCAWQDVDESGSVLSTRFPLPGRRGLDFASGCWFSPGTCVIFNRQTVLEEVGLQNTRLRRLEDYEWFVRLGLAGFVLETQHIIGANIERKRAVNVKCVADSAEEIENMFMVQNLDEALLRRIRAYLALEVAAANYFAGSKLAATRWLMRSFYHMPRTSLHFAPGWRSGPLS